MEKQKEKNLKTKRKRNTTEDKKYNIPVMLRYNQAQHKILKEKAENAGIKLAILVREASLKSNINITSKFDLSTYNQIRKIGVNINQITRKINVIFSNEELKGEYERLKIFIDEIREILKNK